MLSEFVESKKAKELGIDNTPPQHAIIKLQQLVTKLLQPLRDVYGKPMSVSSGYRCEALNKAVGGQPTSQHIKGEAADIKCENPAKLLEVLLSSKIAFDQAILYPTFLHLSYNAVRNRMQVIRK